jgi:hypothetical protein
MASGNGKNLDAYETEAKSATILKGQDRHSWMARGLAGRSPRHGVHSFTNRPRRSRSPCFTCFIWSRSGIGNSFNRNCTRSRMPMQRRLQYEYGDCTIIYVKPAESNGRRVEPRESYWDARCYPLGEIIAEFTSSRDALRAKRVRVLPFRARLTGGFICPPPAMPSLASPSEALPTNFVRNLRTKKLNGFSGRIMLRNSLDFCNTQCAVSRSNKIPTVQPRLHAPGKAVRKATAARPYLWHGLVP